MAISNTGHTLKKWCWVHRLAKAKVGIGTRIRIKTSLLFEFPANPVAIIKGYAGAWLPVTEFGIYLLLALGVWFWLVPPLADMKNLAVG